MFQSLPLTSGLTNLTYAFLALLAVASAARNPPKKNEERMYGSRDAEDGQFPYTVFHILRTTRGFNTCSGSLLTPSWVLLAAHCVNRDAGNPRNHLVVAGKADLNNYLTRRFRTNFQSDLNEAQYDLQERRAAQVHYNPSYSRAGNNDVGLIQVQRPFNLNSRVGVISLSREPMGSRRVCTIAGYGVVEGNQRKHILQYIPDMPAQPAQMCRHQRSRDVICLADITRGICHGDSGGPIVCQGTQRGVASHGLTRGSTGCGVGTVEQYYTDSQRNMAWIDTTMAGAGAATAPAVPQRYKDKTKKPKGKTSLRRKFWSKDDPDPGETFNIITEEEDDVKTV